MQDQELSTEELLRHLEPQAPKAIKHAMLCAANELLDHTRMFRHWSEQLELAASIKVGCMDSQNRVDEIQRQVQLTLHTIAAEMRELL